MTGAEVDREYRREALAEEAEYKDAVSSRISDLGRRLRTAEDKIIELERMVKELYEEKMSRLHGGYEK